MTHEYTAFELSEIRQRQAVDREVALRSFDMKDIEARATKMEATRRRSGKQWQTILEQERGK